MLCATKLSQLAVSQSKAREVRHTIPACSNLDKLSQHAVNQSEARETRHAIPTCYVQPSYLSMQSANQRPVKSDMLSQHAMETNHWLGKPDKLSQHANHRHTIPAYTAKYNLYKRGCKSPEQWTSWHSEIAVHLEEPEQRGAAEQSATTS